jgi:hypothetical protein
LRPVGEQQRLSKNEREPDRREEQAHEAGTTRAQRPPEDAVEKQREDGGRKHPERGREDERDSERPVEHVPASAPKAMKSP